MSKRDDIKGRRERRYSLSGIPPLRGLGDLPPQQQVARFEYPRPPIGNQPMGAKYAPGQGVVGAGPRGPAGPNVPVPSLTVTSAYDARPVRATDFLVFMRITAGSPT